MQAIEVSTQAELNAALKVEGATIHLRDGDYTVVTRGKDAPIIHVHATAALRVEAYDESLPRVVALEESQPHIEARGSSEPHIVAREESQPHIEAWDESQPSIVRQGKSQ